MRRLLLSAFVLATACSTSGAPEDTPTWNADVAPTLARRCVRCHDGKGLGPGDFRDPDTVALLAPVMAKRVAAGEMPPPAADPSCHPYADADRIWMSEDERDALSTMLTAWNDAGHPAGDRSSAPADPIDPIPTLARTDLTVTAAGAYTPEWDDGNEYRCFLLDVDTAESLWVAGFAPRIDHAAISHHTLLFADPSGAASALVTDPATQSWHCPEVIPDPDWKILHAWAPGNNPVTFPEGMGLEIPAGSQLVLQMHYFRSGPDADTIADQPGYDFMTLDSKPTLPDTIFFLPLGPTNFRIPAGDRAKTVSESYPLGEIFGDYDFVVHGVFPHMHVLGSGYDFRATGGSGDACIVTSNAYDFANQPTYMFPEPVHLTSDMTVTASCTWDNSASNPDQLHDPPVDVRWGERTDEEMCFMLSYASVDLGF